MAKNQENQTSKYSEDWLPVKEIRNNGIVVNGKGLEGDQLVTGVRVEPKNIFISGPAVQSMAVNGLRNMYNVIDFEFWLICCDRPVDINLYKSELEVLYNNSQSQEIRKLILEDIQKCELFIGPAVNAVDTEFYILFKTSVKDKELSTKRVMNIISGLASAGLNSRQINEEDSRVLLDSFFNDSKRVEYRTVMTDV